MSVDITIEDNRAYIDKNCPELIEIEDMSDIAAQYGYDNYVYKIYPFELNIANGNFYALFRELGLFDVDCCGSMSADELLGRLNNLKPKNLVESGYREGNVASCGRNIDQCTRYYWELRKIATEAKNRDKTIVWS